VPRAGHRSRAVGGGLLVAVLVLLAGCGNSRTPVPDALSPLTPHAFRTLRFPGARVRLRAPTDWFVDRGRGSLIATVASGPAVVALWRFPRTSPLPADASALASARRSLLVQARRRDPRFALIRSSLASVDGVPAVELDAFEHLGGQLRRVRSTHLFDADAELVLDEYAPPGVFHAVDHAVFSPLKRSLRVLPAPPR
jgi:hypothetical protein